MVRTTKTPAPKPLKLEAAGVEPEGDDPRRRYPCHRCWRKYELGVLVVVAEPFAGKGFRCPACAAPVP